MNTLSPTRLSILLRVWAGITHRRSLNRALGKCPTNGTLKWNLDQLRAAGLVTWQPAQARTLQLTPAGVELLTGLGYVRMGEGHVGRWECWECEGVEVERKA
jgi:hypothetical protein